MTDHAPLVTERGERRYIPVASWSDHYSYPSPTRWRQIACGARSDDALASCLRRVGGRWFVDEHAFLQLLKVPAGGAA